jgi:transposase
MPSTSTSEVSISTRKPSNQPTRKPEAPRFNRLKILWWDRNGYCLLYKRLHRALFRIPPGETLDAASIRLSGAQLAELIAGVARERRR